MRGVAEEEGAEAHALGDVAVAVRLALLVEHLVLGRAAATRYLAFWNKAGVSESETEFSARPRAHRRGRAPTHPRTIHNGHPGPCHATPRHARDKILYVIDWRMGT